MAIDHLLSNKTYCFFSHTIKAQPDNMDLLDAMLEKNIRIIDYEKVQEDSDQRVLNDYREPGFLAFVRFGSSPVSKFDRRHTGRLKKRNKFLTWR